MKLLFMIPRLSYSGAPKMMMWVANKMVNIGHDVTIVTMYKSDVQQIIDDKVNLIELPNKQSKNWLYRNGIGMFKVIKRLRKVVKNENPDVIISFLDSVSYFYILLNKLFWHSKMLLSERADPYSRHGWKSKIRFKISKMATYVVFQTKEARDFFKDDYKNKSSVIENPVVVNEELKNNIEVRNNKEFKRDNNIVTVGRLCMKQKRQDILLKAFSIFVKNNNDFNLLIYGSGDDETKIKELIDLYNLNDNVKLMGRQDNILNKIVHARCFVLSSDFEGIPNSLIEAMSIGLPCVSTNCSPGGAKLLIDNGENGFIVEKGNYEELAKKIELIVHDDELANKISKNAMSVVEKFSEKVIAEKWDKAFRSASRL